MSKNKVSFDQLSALLDATTNGMDEAFEFRWLRETGTVEREVWIQTSLKESMIRVTFPFHDANGRGRIWLKRVNRKIDKQDVFKLLEIARFLSVNLECPIRMHKPTESEIGQFLTLEQILNFTYAAAINQIN
jgi:hypothetical protein